MFVLGCNQLFELRKGLQLHMCISQPPCGDACNLLDHDSSSSAMQSTNTSHSTQQGVMFSNTTYNLQLSSCNAAATTQPDACGTSTDLIASGESLCSCCNTPKPAVSDAVQHQTVAFLDSVHSPNCNKVVAPSSVTQQNASNDLPLLSHQDTKNETQQSATSQQGSMQLATTSVKTTLHKQQQAGSLQRKPGRGDATLSMSCSDKLARWTLLGIQVSCSLTVACS